jgi:hypothetical protein
MKYFGRNHFEIQPDALLACPNMRYKKLLAALAMTFTFAAGLAPTAATAQAGNYQLSIRRGSNYSCIWADHAGAGAPIYRNRASGCPSNKPSRWNIIPVRNQNGTHIFHLQLSGTQNCISITGLPQPAEDVQLERCTGGAHYDDDFYFWPHTTTEDHVKFRNSDPNYVDYCLQADPNDLIGNVRIQVASCNSADTQMRYMPV